MSSVTPNINCIQYTNDSICKIIGKINQKDTRIKGLEKDLTSIAKRSIETNLVFNTGKTKFMLLISNHLSAWHKLKDQQLQIWCNNTKLERVSEWKTTWFKYR